MNRGYYRWTEDLEDLKQIHIQHVHGRIVNV